MARRDARRSGATTRASRPRASTSAQLLEGFRNLRAELDAFKPDVVLIWGDDQYENFRSDCVPAFCVYMFDELECKPFGGGRRPFKCDESAYGLPPETPIRVRGHKEAAAGLCRTLLGEHFDVAYATETRAEAGLAHSFSNTLVFLDCEQRGFDYPVLPFHVNCYGNQLLKGARPDLQRRGSPDVSPAFAHAAALLRNRTGHRALLRREALAGRAGRLLELVARDR